MQRRAFEVAPNDAGQTLEAFVAQALGVPTTEASAYLARGAVYVRGRRSSEGARVVSVGDRVVVVVSEAGRSALAPAPAAHAPTVLHADDELLALDKPAGMTTQPTPARSGESLWDWAKGRFGSEVGLVHRLDRETSGLVVFGRNARATSALAKAFRSREVEKTYLAIIARGLPSEGDIDLPISPDPARPGRYRASQRANGLSARTRFVRAFEAEAWAGVELFPETGRTHQLRAHLTALGFPIVGDRRYGGPAHLGGQEVSRCLLHAHRLTLPHPEHGKRLELIAELPPDLATFWLSSTPHGQREAHPVTGAPHRGDDDPGGGAPGGGR